jgi:hypothetical protein
MEKIKEQTLLGVAMLRGYQSWQKSVDGNTKFLATETSWEVPLPGTNVKLAGRFDAVVERPDGLWVMDFKTTGSTRVNWTNTDLQATAYTLAARKLYGPKVRGVVFRFLRKKEPYTYEKLILKDGSVTRRKNLTELTTYHEYRKALAIAVLQEQFPGKEGWWYEERLQGDLGDEFHAAFVMAQRAYWDELQALKEQNTFYWDVAEDRTEEQLRRYLSYVILPAAKEMTSKRKGRWVGPTGLGASFAVCANCSFKTPCQQWAAGADFRMTLEEDFQRRVYQ